MAEDRRLFLQAQVLASLVEEIVEQRLAAFDIRPGLFALLSHVARHAPVAPTTLAVVAGLPTTTLRDNLQQLVDKKLIVRSSNPDDGRSYLVRLTARGTRIIEVVDPELRGAYLALEQRLGGSLSAYSATLDELNGALRDVLRPLDEHTPVPAAAPASVRVNPGR